jgi:hypothetical protein
LSGVYGVSVEKVPKFRVSAYVDGFNLYYGLRGICRTAEQPWKWLDLRKFIQETIDNSCNWSVDELKIIYCTARRPDHLVSGQSARQDRYLRALQLASSVDEIVLGRYKKNLLRRPLGIKIEKKPQIFRPEWPLKARMDDGGSPKDLHLMAQVVNFEEKGTDVNLGARLLIDHFEGRFDAAVVVTNDSDLETPVRFVRHSRPIGLVNPTTRPLAGPLQIDDDAASGSWTIRPKASSVVSCQLPEKIGEIARPEDW